MASTSLVRFPTFNSHSPLLSQRHSYNLRFNLILPSPSPPPTTTRPISHISLCSSSTSSLVVQQQNQLQQDQQDQEFTSSSPQSSSDDLPPGACKGCGKTEIERGCNGEGRIQGGIATVPGFGWWPIKAYRPCPAFVASGGRYTRQGQSMDEVAFGRGGRDSSVTNVSDDVQTRNKRKDPKKKQ